LSFIKDPTPIIGYHNPMLPTNPRLRRERQTLQAMFRLYCRTEHGQNDHTLCPECQELEDYALERLARCPFQADKPTCANCAVHCYKPEMRQRVRLVMRVAGPRMLLRHPILAVRHMLDGRRPTPSLKRRKSTTEN